MIEQAQKQDWILHLELDAKWVRAHRGDFELPCDMFVQRIRKRFPNVVRHMVAVTRLEITIPDETEMDVRGSVLETLGEMVVERSAVSGTLQAKGSDVRTDLFSGEAVQGDNTPPATSAGIDALLSTLLETPASLPPSAPKALGNIQALLGADSFKALAQEITTVAPYVLEHNARRTFCERAYLFSIGDGCGMRTRLNLLEALLSELGLKACSDGVEQVLLAPATRTDDITMVKPLDTAFTAVENAGSDCLCCLDITHWMDKVRDADFRDFLLRLRELNGGITFVFRLPVVDKRTRRQVLSALGDVFTIREVEEEPYTMAQFEAYADGLLEKQGFRMDDTARQSFAQRIADEKSDGHFYSFNTIKKVQGEMLYQKLLSDAQTGANPKGTDGIIRAQQVPMAYGASLDTRPASEQLGELIGIEKIRARIDEVLVQIEAARSMGKDGLRPAMHMQFVGSPGTGKTTVARILGQLLKERGILSRGHFFEYHGRDFVGEYIGQTAPKTAAMCRDAYGSILFIDEAYSLYRDERERKDFGIEALETLIAQMENHRDDFMVILAGYQEDMARLMKGNVGLESRIPYTIEFPNYTRDDLAQIFLNMAGRAFPLAQDLEGAAQAYFSALPDGALASQDFANARFVRNLFERTWAKASVRCQMEPDMELRLSAQDFSQAVADKEFQDLQKKGEKRMGFL